MTVPSYLRSLGCFAIHSCGPGYLRKLHEILAHSLREAQTNGELVKRLDASELTMTLIATVQGGFVVSRVYRDRNAINRVRATAKIAAQITTADLMT
ncbi:TetR family transcriptional regulator C-terminal domain-containing protein [Bradyrhizobium rifense]|uniref:TetR family transcriptional regulator C-terminal domain-containing protein n=1 Tax=Bradyrhizobium rifense TaxID=515499 RepID=UPI003D31437A